MGVLERRSIPGSQTPVYAEHASCLAVFVSEESISFEVVKLLLQVAWADHDVAAEEAEAILAFARRHELTDAQLAMVEAALSGGGSLPLPNLGALKLHKVRVLGELRELLVSDLHVNDDEDVILKQVSALL